MNFTDYLKEETNKKLTENGALAYESTTNACLDLFSMVGALRTRTPEEIEELFIKALNEDKLLATKIMFYARDCRGGLGERRTFKIMLKYLTKNPQHYKTCITKNIRLISEFGRYDDLLELFDTPFETDIIEYFDKQLTIDFKNMSENKEVSLLAKWIPTENCSNAKRREYAKKIIAQLGIRPKAYRKTISSLRKYIDVVEKKMCANKWEDINYETVPSKAMSKYRQAFLRHGQLSPVKNSFNEYLEKAEKGEAKINAKTLMPYEIFKKLGLDSNWRTDNFSFRNKDKTLELQWDALPNYVSGENNVMIMADTSGSMMGRPMNVALSLAMYFAERNKGAYANKFMTFSSRPTYVELIGNDIYEKIRNVKSIVSDTNLEAGLKLILDTATKNNLPAEELPKALVIISDMEFNQATSGNSKSFYDSMRDMYRVEGYEIPNIIFWNVDSRQNLVHTKSNVKGVQMVSGSNPSVFKEVMNIIGTTPMEAMLKILNNERYNAIEI